MSVCVCVCARVSFPHPLGRGVGGNPTEEFQEEKNVGGVGVASSASDSTTGSQDRGSKGQKTKGIRRTSTFFQSPQNCVSAHSMSASLPAKVISWYRQLFHQKKWKVFCCYHLVVPLYSFKCKLLCSSWLANYANVANQPHPTS